MQACPSLRSALRPLAAWTLPSARHCKRSSSSGSWLGPGPPRPAMGGGDAQGGLDHEAPPRGALQGRSSSRGGAELRLVLGSEACPWVPSLCPGLPPKGRLLNPTPGSSGAERREPAVPQGRGS